MQVSATSANPPLTRPLIRIGWMLLPFWLALMFTASLSRAPFPLIAAQVAFLLPIAAGVACSAMAVRVGPTGTERQGWLFLLGAMSFVGAAELYYSGYQLLVDPAGPHDFGLYDVLNAVGAGFMIAMLVAAAGLPRRRVLDGLRVSADAVALLAVVFVALYHYWVKGLAGDGALLREPARWTAYVLVGLVMMVLVGIAYLNIRPIQSPQVVIPLGLSIAIYSAGLVLWPVWQSQPPGGVRAVGAFMTCVLMLGNYLMFMSALTRLTRHDLPWRVSVSRLEWSVPVWPATLLSVVVLIAVGIIAMWASGEPQGASRAPVYAGAAMIATLALVARTGFSSLEAGEWRRSSVTDPVTGALNHRSFQELCEDKIISAKRGEPFTIALLDLDDFSRINRLLGHAQGDAVLRTIAEALAGVSGPGDSVCRMSGDEFAVIAPGLRADDASQLGRRLLAAINELELPQVPGLSASVGLVTCEGQCDREELLKQADAAQTWAKYHGKNRAVVYDDHMVHALDVEERLRIRERESHHGIARALSAAVDARDTRNYYHSRNVASLVALVCAALGFDDDRCRRAETAALLHDVGKIALPDEVLRSVRHSPRQQRLAREHTTLGQTLVESLGEDGIPQWVRGHHERWDGAGYPDGLVAEEIPLEARIIALADAYDTMTSGQRDGRQISKGAALQEIDHGIGSRFDPELAERFIHVVGATSSLGWTDDWPAA